MEWEKLPNGKWKPKKIFKKENGKYQFDDPRYIAISQKKMAAVKIMCLNCKGFYTLLEPCIHHLPDGYKNYKLKQEYKKSKNIDDVKPATLFDSEITNDYIMEDET